jgi:arylsulfatase A-like enzyme
MIEWPAMIRRHMETDSPANVYDMLPTILDILKVLRLTVPSNGSLTAL